MGAKKGSRKSAEAIAKMREGRAKRRERFGPTVNRRKQESDAPEVSFGIDFSVGPGYRRYGFRLHWEDRSRSDRDDN